MIYRECSTHGEIRNACKILVTKPEGRRPFERQRRRWEYDIKVGHLFLARVKMLIVVFWVVTLSGLGVSDQGFGGMCRLHLHFTTFRTNTMPRVIPVSVTGVASTLFFSYVLGDVA